MESHNDTRNSRRPSQLVNDYLERHSDIFRELQDLRKKAGVSGPIEECKLTYSRRAGQMSRPINTSRSNVNKLMRLDRLCVADSSI